MQIEAKHTQRQGNGFRPFALPTSAPAAPRIEVATLDQAIEKFLIHLDAADRSPATITAYRARFRRFLAYEEISGDMPLEAITPELLDRWAASLREKRRLYADHRYREPVERPLSDATRLAYIQTAKTLLAFCHRRGYLDRDVGADLERPHVDHKATNKVMPLQTLYRMLDAAQEKAQAEDGNARDLALLMFAADTGARRGEIVSLRIDNLRLEQLEADVIGKTGRRPVDYTEETADVLRLWLQERPDVDHDYVFTGSMAGYSRNRGGPLSPDAVNSIFRRLAKTAGVTGKCNPQAVRHLVGQQWTDRVNLELVRQKLGHRSVTTTAMFYAHQDMSRVKAATKLHSVLNGYRNGNGEETGVIQA
jgi:integrase